MFQQVPGELYFSRHDPSDPRRGEQVEVISSLDSINSGVVIAGYPDDEGIKNNGGRLGASDGPNAIRNYLYRMVADQTKLYDLGNLELGKNLETRQEVLSRFVAQGLNQGLRWIGLGGGHDYGYADGAGFLRSSTDHRLKPVIINIDAHLDVRKPNPNITSGTPFYRLYQLGIPFDFVQIGIQSQCNSKAHWEWCESQGAKIISLGDYWTSRLHLDEYVVQQTADLFVQKRNCYLSVDIDAFAWPFAIGSSQSWPTGLTPQEVWPLLNLIFKRFHVRVLGVYETAPRLDVDGGTAKLASQIVDYYIREGVSP